MAPTGKSSFTILMLAAAFAVSHACAGQPNRETPALEHAQQSGSETAGTLAALPADNAHIVYVSESHGNDDTGRIYNLGDPEIGTDPRHPEGPIKAFKTFTAAYHYIRDGEPDWILVKRGDSFYGSSAALDHPLPVHDLLAAASASPHL